MSSRSQRMKAEGKQPPSPPQHNYNPNPEPKPRNLNIHDAQKIIEGLIETLKLRKMNGKVDILQKLKKASDLLEGKA